jgi:CBS domain-containing protein
MKVRELMTSPVIRIGRDETVEVAARTLTHYNIGALPVCGGDGRVCGMVTDRDLVTRCIASGKTPAQMKVRDVMTGNVVSVRPDADAATVANLMGRQQVRRLPVVENGKLCGMVSLGDLVNRKDSCAGATDALTHICSNISAR